MGLRAYVVTKEIGEHIFNCHYPDEWFERLDRLGKFDNGHWMEVTEEDLEEMEADEKWPLTEAEKEILANIRKAMKATEEDCLYLEYF